MLTMLKKWTNPYIILALTIVGITLAIVAETIIELFLVNVIFLITIILISLRNSSNRERIYSPQKLKILITLILIAFLADCLLHFKLLTIFNQVFLVTASLIKVLVFGYEWVMTVKILSNRQKVNSQTIVLAIISYLFIGIIWSFIYLMIWQINPHSFQISNIREYELKTWNLAMYYSLITLTTVGYGGIVPTGKWVMLLSNFEAMTGAIYLTVIVARLVSLYSNTE
jgi:hypothetical protein